MPYYLIHQPAKSLEQFQSRFPFLKSAKTIQSKKDLANINPSTSSQSCFFAPFLSSDEDLDEMILIVRDHLPTAKIIYVCHRQSLEEQKKHQETPVGGDAYVAENISKEDLELILVEMGPQEMNLKGNKLEQLSSTSIKAEDQLKLLALKKLAENKHIENIFNEVFTQERERPAWQSSNTLKQTEIQEQSLSGDSMSDKDQELSLDDLGELEIDPAGGADAQSIEDEGMELDIGSEVGIDLAEDGDVPEFNESESADEGMELDLSSDLGEDSEELLSDDIDEDFTTEDELSLDNESEADISLSDDSLSDGSSLDDELSLSEDIPELAAEEHLSLSDDGNELSEDLDFNGLEDLNLSDDIVSLGNEEDLDLSAAAKEKLKEIDQIMDLDASQVSLSVASAEPDADMFNMSVPEESQVATPFEESQDRDIDKPLVSDDLNLDSLNFNSEIEEEIPKEEKPKKKIKEEKEVKDTRTQVSSEVSRDFKEISGAYSAEMERLQATLSNLRVDREELLLKIVKLEEEKVLQARQNLTLRADLDEKKIELTIIRKKLNEEINELKDRLKLHEEKKLILEEKNRILFSEIEKSAQKNKIDVKRIQMRERELEQKLELLKADSETQIRHRDLKILELKRKIDAMEFDMESISVQEKRSVESRFELEDKLDKAIKTLRSAISVLEDESDKAGVLEALKKNIDM